MPDTIRLSDEALALLRHLLDTKDSRITAENLPIRCRSYPQPAQNQSRSLLGASQRERHERAPLDQRSEMSDNS